MDQLFQIAPPGQEKLHGFTIPSGHGPEEFAQADLPQAVVSQNHLADGDVTGGDLPHPQHQGPGELGQDEAAEEKLAKTEDQPDPELGHGDQAQGELADGDDALGHPQLAPAVSAEGNVDQREAPVSAGGFPFKPGTGPGGVGRLGGAAAGTGPGLVAHFGAAFPAGGQGHDGSYLLVPKLLINDIVIFENYGINSLAKTKRLLTSLLSISK